MNRVIVIARNDNFPLLSDGVRAAPVQRTAAAPGRSLRGVEERPLSLDDVLATVTGLLVFAGLAYFFLVIA
jgi:hypothetical protein